MILHQFLDYKGRTNSRLAECAWYKENVKVLELTLARKIPVFEAEFGLSETTPLRLYDCLVPRIKEHRQHYYDIRSDSKMEDLKLKLEIRKLEQEMQATELPKLREENQMLREKICEYEA